MMNIFKDSGNGLANCEIGWDMSWIIPIPKEEIPCPCCGRKTLKLRESSFHTRHASPSKYRCLLSFKCLNCSHVPMFGVVVSEKMFEAAKENDHIRMNWRDLNDLWLNKNNG